MVTEFAGRSPFVGSVRGRKCMPLQRDLRVVVAAVVVACASLTVAGQSNAAGGWTKGPSGYDQPPKNILDVMHAPLPPTPLVSRKKDRMLLVYSQSYPSIARVATPY